MSMSMLMVFMMIIRIMTMVMVVIDMMVMDITITTAAPISVLRCSHQSMITSPHMYRYVLSPNILLESTLKSGGGGGGIFLFHRPLSASCYLASSGSPVMQSMMSVRACLYEHIFYRACLLNVFCWLICFRIGSEEQATKCFWEAFLLLWTEASLRLERCSTCPMG